jgi:hypothetical protein
MKRDAKHNSDSLENVAYYKRLAQDRALVQKRSGKPFKSGSKVNTVIGMAYDEYLKRSVFLFSQDTSLVECWRCIPLRDLQ